MPTLQRVAHDKKEVIIRRLNVFFLGWSRRKILWKELIYQIQDVQVYAATE